MNFLKEKLTNYCEAHTSPQSNVLYELERETHLTTLAPQMISGFYQGRLLSFLSKMKRPKSILEIGTFTAYAAICLAEGLDENGLLHTIEINEELESIIRKYIQKAKLENKIKVYIGNAHNIIPTIDSKFDMAFIDAAKFDYEFYYEMVLEKMNTDGIILADNVLWSGKVLDESHQDEDTKALRAFNQKIQNDPRVENILLPIRDGLMLIRKLFGSS
ncbi:MAG TPA: O-methyltransferase [Saprospiraceae bacterium]|nr:O-methyltransferase [Saprospiraceae bacterium]